MIIFLSYFLLFELYADIVRCLCNFRRDPLSCHSFKRWVFPSSSSVTKEQFFRKSTSPGLVLKLVLLLWVFCASLNGVVFADADTDASVLLQLKNSVSDPSGLLSSWNHSVNSGHCSWFGVFCNSNSQVVALNITGNSGGGEGEGGIPTSWSKSVSLEILNVAGNLVNGTIPGFIGRLKAVYLSYNSLSGDVPSEIGDNCGKLEHLDLAGNFLVDKIPSSLGNCSQLRTLMLYSNMLEEGIPAELGQLQALEVLDVSRNSLSSSLPRELGNCSELSVLVLSLYV
ncbi:hypothetical protein GBA52_028869 [Prunus armeniaca]|nr:hypothetical protein GBA52_028869 [Prunus armeniaca]